MDEDAVFRLQQGQKKPYDIPTEEPVDWAHQTARGVINDLSERRGLNYLFAEIKKLDAGSVATEIVTAVAAIIREGESLYNPGWMEVTEEGDYSFTQRLFPAEPPMPSLPGDEHFVGYKVTVEDRVATERSVTLSISDEKQRSAAVTLSVLPSVSTDSLLPVFKIDDGEGGTVVEVVSTHAGMYVKFPDTYEINDARGGNPLASPSFLISKKPVPPPRHAFRLPHPALI